MNVNNGFDNNAQRINGDFRILREIQNNQQNIGTIVGFLKAIKKSVFVGNFSDSININTSNVISWTETINVGDISFDSKTPTDIIAPYDGIFRIALYAGSQFNQNSATPGDVQWEPRINGVAPTGYVNLIQYDDGTSGTIRTNTQTNSKQWVLFLNEGDILTMYYVLSGGVILDSVVAEIQVSGDNVSQFQI
jgi:hypothetical protein